MENMAKCALVKHRRLSRWASAPNKAMQTRAPFGLASVPNQRHTDDYCVGPYWSKPATQVQHQHIGLMGMAVAVVRAEREREGALGALSNTRRRGVGNPKVCACVPAPA
jgi:hypothetical protein